MAIRGYSGWSVGVLDTLYDLRTDLRRYIQNVNILGDEGQINASFVAELRSDLTGSQMTLLYNDNLGSMFMFIHQFWKFPKDERSQSVLPLILCWMMQKGRTLVVGVGKIAGRLANICTLTLSAAVSILESTRYLFRQISLPQQSMSYKVSHKVIQKSRSIALSRFIGRHEASQKMETLITVYHIR